MTVYTQNRYYSNTAAITTLATTGGINATATTMITGSQNGWPTTFPFVARIEPSTANEELVLVTSGAGTSASPYNITRAYDGTAAISHLQGVVVSHGMAQIDLQDPQVHLNLRGSTALDQYGFLAHNLPASAWSSVAPIQTVNPTSTTVTFSSIPQTYTHLRIIGMFQAASGGMTVQFNNDSTAADYSILTERGFGVNSGTATTTSYGGSNQSIGQTDTGAWGYITIDIPFYTNTTVHKIASSTCYGFGTTARITAGITGLLWNSAAAVTQLVFSAAGGSFVSGSTFNLYGLL